MNPVRQIALSTLMTCLCVFSACRQSGSPPPRSPAMEKPNVVEERWPDGKVRLHREVLRQPDGTLINDGTYTTWYDSGEKEYEATYVHGQLEGVAKSWHRNGRQWTEEHYVSGKREGVRYAWDESGLLRKEEHYVNDKPDGTWTVWDEKGKIKAQQHFNRGAPLP